MPPRKNPKTVTLRLEGHEVVIVLRYEGYELRVDGRLIDEWKGIGFSIPFIQGTRLRATTADGNRFEANIRNMAIGFRLEVLSNGKLVHSQFFT